MFKNLSIKAKLVILVLVSILSLLIVSGKSIKTDLEQVSSYKTLDKGVVLSTKISALVHETQKERGATAGYLGSKGKKFGNTLQKQRILTNKAILDIKEYISKIDMSKFGSDMQNCIREGLGDLKNITDIRSKVDAMSIATPVAISYYTKMNSKFLNSVVEISKTSNSSDISKELVAYSSFLLSKERAGIERAVGTNTLARGNFGEGMEMKLDNLICAQNTYMDNFLRFATSDAKKFYNKTLTGDSIKEVNRIRKVLVESSRKKLIVSKIKSEIGYGGFIYNFYRYLSTKDDKYIKQAEKNYKELKGTIAQYESLKNITQDEKSLLKDIENQFSNYYTLLSKGDTLQPSGINVDDKSAIAALKKLDSSFFVNSSPDHWFKTITKKINLLKKVDDYLAQELVSTINTKLDKVTRMLYIYILLELALLAITILIAIVIIRDVKNSLSKFQEGLLSFFKYLDKESSDVDDMDINTSGEIGQMAKIVNDNIQKTKALLEEDRALIEDVKRTAGLVKDGYIKQNIQSSSSNKELNELKNIFNDMLDDIASRVCGDINKIQNALEHFQKLDFTHRIDNATGETAKGLNLLADMISDMLSKNSDNGVFLGENSDTLNEDVKELNNISKRIDELLKTTVSLTQQATMGLNETSEQSAEVESHANEIKSVVSVIGDIADQTNLLALNAAIEAARAGEHGRGFAVVADEVRKLAERTQKSLSEVNATIQILVQSVSGIVENISARTEEINKINSSMGEMEEVGYKNAEVTKKVDEVAINIVDISKKIKEDISDKKF